MRTLFKLVTVAAAAATVTAMAVAPVAMADPPSGTHPKTTDVVGVGSDTIEYLLDQFSVSYNASHKTGPKLYSWDATNPVTGAIGDDIVTKSGCAKIPRPDGSGAGVTALTTENGTTKGSPCIDFARSSSNRSTTSPPYGKGGIAYVALGGDAVTYATQPGSAAPKSLTVEQLNEIYTCAVTNWKQVGGKNAPIHAFLPQSSSGTRSFFLTAIGITSLTPGSCVSDGATKADPGGRIEENEGVNTLLNTDKADVIFPYSVGKYLAETYHSAKCLNHFCTAATSGKDKNKICVPTKTQNQFGCNTHGTMVLNEVAKTAPTTPWPLPSGSCTTSCPTVNKKFDAVMTRSLYIVVKWNNAKGNVDHIPAYLAPFFSYNGYTCSAAAKPILEDYGFLVFSKGNSKDAHSETLCGDTH
jgi:ABC-type phosphate transport system substrate-binding protein